MKTIVTTFARAAIPTLGHELLFSTVSEIAEQEKADAKIFLSHTYNKNNPIDYSTKVQFLKECGINHILETDTVNSIFDVLYYCKNEQYQRVIFVVGDDRVSEVKKRVSPYLGESSNNGLPFLFEVRSSGPRNENDTKSVIGISGTKMRRFVVEGDFESFNQWLPKNASATAASKLWDLAKQVLTPSS